MISCCKCSSGIGGPLTHCVFHCAARLQVSEIFSPFPLSNAATTPSREPHLLARTVSITRFLYCTCGQGGGGVQEQIQDILANPFSLCFRNSDWYSLLDGDNACQQEWFPGLRLLSPSHMLRCPRSPASASSAHNSGRGGPSCCFHLWIFEAWLLWVVCDFAKV